MCRSRVRVLGKSLFALLLLGVGTAGLTAQEPCIFPIEFGRRDAAFEVPDPPSGIVSADFDGDGIDDLALGNRPSLLASTVTVLLSQADGSFLTQHLDNQRSFSDIAAGDIDGDGDPDVVTANSSRLFLYSNQGDGIMSEATELPVRSGTRAVSIADVTGDGLQDFVITQVLGGNVAVLANRGGGVYEVVAEFAVSEPADGKAADIDGDGDLDLAILSSTESGVHVFLQGDDGDFSKSGAHSLESSEATFLELGDLDRDGFADMVASGNNWLGIFLSRGDGTFESPQLIDSFGAATSLGLGDFDLDDDLDVAFGSQRCKQCVSVAENAGDGSFLETVLSFPVDRSEVVAASDVDGDGRLDLAYSARGPNRVSVLWNDPARVLERLVPVERDTLGIGGEPHSIATADFNLDGFPDIVTSNGHCASIAILLGNSSGTLLNQGLQDLPGTQHLFTVSTGDMDQNGAPDIVIGDLDRSQVVIAHNSGSGSFERIERHPIAAPPWMVMTADIDGDEVPDVVTAGGNSISVYPNDGAGGLGDRIGVESGFFPRAVVALDADLDGDLDLAAANSSSRDVTLSLNAGDGSFLPSVSYAVAGEPFYVVAGDFNQDGLPDFASAEQSADPLSAVTVFLNSGDANFARQEPISLVEPPYSALTVDFTGDGVLDIVLTSQQASQITVLPAVGDGSFKAALKYSSPEGPRFATSADIDLDGDNDLIVANRVSETVTTLLNLSTAPISDLDYRESLCSFVDFQGIATRRTDGGVVDFSSKFLLPASDDPELLQTVYQNVNRFPLHEEFLPAAFPQRFGGLSREEYNDLVNRRATRKYYAGVLNRVRTPEGFVYGFNVLVDTSTPQERLGPEEIGKVYETLRESFFLEPIGYFPEDTTDRDIAAGWENPGFPVFLDTGPSIDFQAYTQGIGYGRVKVFDREDFEAANERGAFSFQDILILDHTPRDIEGVIAGLVTAGPQSELSHVFIRMARRNTPNAFSKAAHEQFAEFAGALVRMDVRPGGVDLTLASPEEAQEFWDNNQPRLRTEPAVDADFSELSSLAEIAAMDLAGDTDLVSRFGGKASNLARLRHVLDTPEMREYRESGFAVPVRYYLEFIRSNRLPSAVDPAREVTYEDYLEELFANADFQTDPEVRFQALDALGDHMRDEGVVDADLVRSIADRIREVLQTAADTRVRFRSSSNIEDDLVFTGAGLYNSTSGCIEDDFDADADGPSHCDATREEERGIARALKRVWRSLWNFRAYEERAFFGVDQSIAAMGILVNRAFIDEAANGVAFTGSPTDPLDRRYQITVQKGEESVVSPEPGVVAERDFLTVSPEAVIIERGQSSSLVEVGESVVTDPQLEELGRLMGFIDERFPLQLGETSREDVLLDMEFKFMPDGELAVKQVRPFLLNVPRPPTPTFHVEIPAGRDICGVFTLAGPARAADEEYELKSLIKLETGVIDLPTVTTSFELDLIGQVRFGPDRERAIPRSVGVVSVARNEITRLLISYRFNFTQAFELDDGTTLEVSLARPLEFRISGETPVGSDTQILDEAYFTRTPGEESILGSIDGSAVHYGSCDLSSLPLVEVRADLADGSRLRLLKRFDETIVSEQLRTSPAALVRAELNLRDSTPQIQTSYWNLVYSALRHNRSPHYRVIIDRPLPLPGLPSDVHAVDLVFVDPIGDGPRSATALYLGSEFQVLEEVEVLSFETGPLAEIQFLRGDSNNDGIVGLADALHMLNYLYKKGEVPACKKAADANDDGRLNILDGTSLLGNIFRGGGAPLPGPFPGCGADPTPDTLPCEGVTACNG